MHDIVLIVGPTWKRRRDLERLLEIFNFILLGILITLTIIMLFTFRKPRVIGFVSALISIFISLLMLILFILFSDTRLNMIVFAPIFGFGILVGLLFGYSMNLQLKNGKVIGKHSWFFLLVFGFSLWVSYILLMVGTMLFGSIALIPLTFSVGSVIGREVSIFFRRLLLQKSTTKSI